MTVAEAPSVGFTQELKIDLLRVDLDLWVLFLCLIWSCIAIERIIYLNFATTNTEKLVEDIESALKSGGVDSAKEICRNTPGLLPQFLSGLDRAGEGVESAEKAVVAYGGVQMGQLEKNVSWISFLLL